jgi:hypothetical protein
LGGTLDLSSPPTIGNTAPNTGRFTTLTVDDNTTLGSSNTDTVTFNARINSDFDPATDNAFDLGRVGHEWRNLYIDGTANIDSLIADTADINAGSIDGTTIGASTASTGAFTTLSATGVTTVQAGTVSAPAITTTGDTNTGIFFPAADTIAFAEGGAEAMRIDSAGNVGIGTSSVFDANTRLELSKSGNCQHFISSTDGVRMFFSASGSTSGVLGTFSNHPLVFKANDTERARIDTSGNLLVGTTSAVSASGAYVKSASQNRVFSFQNTANINGDQNIWSLLGSNCNTTASPHLICDTGGTNRLIIWGNGDVVNTNNSYGAISDAKLKENVVDATPKLDKLNQVRVVNFNMIGEEQKQLGVIAQELEQIFPSMVDESPDRDAEGNILETKTKSVKYSVFVPMLIKAIQEQQAIITALTARVEALEGTQP